MADSVLIGPGDFMTAYGERQGLRAMSDEATRQAEEWEASNRVQQKTIEEELARRKAALSADYTAPGLTARSQALGGANALGRGMGLGSAQQAQVTSALAPVATVAAQQGGQQVFGRQRADSMNRMNTDLTQEKMNQRAKAALYAARLKNAGNEGSTWRQLGGAISGAQGVGEKLAVSMLGGPGAGMAFGAAEPTLQEQANGVDPGGSPLGGEDAPPKRKKKSQFGVDFGSVYT